MEVGFPYISGYKPLSQYQNLLADAVLEHIEADATLSQLALDFAEAPVTPAQPVNILALMTARPAILESVRSALSTTPRRRHARRIDYLAHEAGTRTLVEPCTSLSRLPAGGGRG